ncbi:L,D-transpeptidase [Sphingomonas sp. MMS24-J13]|uniref:L,D-transpeptidase n=1 Tax=Sphingomonas sp. MMS24-J13 TaxID=3238686 RepID=UPI00384D3F27
MRMAGTCGASLLLCLAVSLASGRAAAAAPTVSADFAGRAASAETREMADRIVASGDNQGLPFIIVDKIAATAFAFADHGRLLGASPVLLGLTVGDVSPPGIGSRKLRDIGPGDRITPSGRFVASLGADLGKQDVLWVDYDAAISLHRVFTGKPSERRLARLATPAAGDNRISYGCINAPVEFYDRVIHPLFFGTSGIVYILPDRQSLAEAFPGLFRT